MVGFSFVVAAKHRVIIKSFNGKSVGKLLEPFDCGCSRSYLKHCIGRISNLATWWKIFLGFWMNYWCFRPLTVGNYNLATQKGNSVKWILFKIELSSVSLKKKFKKVLLSFGSIYPKLDGGKGWAIVLPRNGGDWRDHQGVMKCTFAVFL